MCSRRSRALLWRGWGREADPSCANQCDGSPARCLHHIEPGRSAGEPAARVEDHQRSAAQVQARQVCVDPGEALAERILPAFAPYLELERAALDCTGAIGPRVRKANQEIDATAADAVLAIDRATIGDVARDPVYRSCAV